MPKPVLSDSLFNADDVATAVLNEANLQIANSNLGVTDIMSSIQLDSDWTSYGNDNQAYHFMGFVFISLACYRTNPPGSDTMWRISDPYRPSHQFKVPTVSHQGDTADFVSIQTGGDIVISSATNPGSSDWHSIINAWYRI